MLQRSRGKVCRILDPTFASVKTTPYVASKSTYITHEANGSTFLEVYTSKIKNTSYLQLLFEDSLKRVIHIISMTTRQKGGVPSTRLPSIILKVNSASSSFAKMERRASTDRGSYQKEGYVWKRAPEDARCWFPWNKRYLKQIGDDLYYFDDQEASSNSKSGEPKIYFLLLKLYVRLKKANPVNKAKA